MRTWLEIIFWLSLLGLGYIYVGYPLLIVVLGKLFRKPVRKGPCGGQVSVVIAAYNEQLHIERKIESLLASEAAQQIAEIVVASDGSTDGTADVVRGIGDPRVRLIEFPERRGKAAVLNDVLPLCTSEILILTDARQDVHPAALGALLANLADPAVGVVSGELVFRMEDDATASSQGIGAYWSYEKLIRKHEAAFASVPGATGALYAIRKKLVHPIPGDTLLDDVVIPMHAVMQGFRCVFEAGAEVYDKPASTPEQESLRKRRTIAGNAQLMRLYPAWLLPSRNPIWLQFVSHKIGRLASPFLLLLLLAVSTSFACRPGFRWFFLAQVLFYTLSLAGWILRSGGHRLGVLGVPMMFVSLNITTLLALWDAVRGRYTAAWARSA